MEKDIMELIRRRDKTNEDIQRVKGRLDSAQQELASITEEFRKKKVDPSQVDVVIAQLEAKLQAEAAKLTEQIVLAEEQVKPFLD